MPVIVAMFLDVSWIFLVARSFSSIRWFHTQISIFKSMTISQNIIGNLHVGTCNEAISFVFHLIHSIEWHRYTTYFTEFPEIVK